MSPLQSQDPKEALPKKRSFLGMLFNPRVDREIEPLKESAGMFVRMLALIFASYNLFPKDYPALNNIKLRLTLRDVLGIAFKRLSFTKKGLPQIAVFLAVTGCLVFSALFLLTLLSSLFVGSAHAQGLFTSPAKEDWGIQWINFLFMGDEMTVSGSKVAFPSGNTLQKAMGTALSFYSTAVLALAGFLLIYHLAFMIAETAHTGKPMGKANQIWGPIRLVFAIGMLVPIGAGSTSGSTSAVTGYNTAQYLAMQVGRWGSGLASQAWSTFSSSLNTAGSMGACDAGVGSPSCVNISSDARDTVLALAAMDSCAYMMNYYIYEGKVNEDATAFDKVTGWLTGGGGTNKVFLLSDLIADNPLKVGKHFLSLETTSNNDFDVVDPQEFCGGYQVMTEPYGVYQAVHEARLNQFKGLLTDVHTYVQDYAPDMIKSSGEYSEQELKKRADDLEKLIANYENNLKTALESAMKTAQIAADKQLADETKDGRFIDTGWLTAATWFNRITQLMSDRMGSLKSPVVTFIKPSILGDAEHENKTNGEILGAAQSTFYSLTKFINSTKSEVKYTEKTKDVSKNCTNGKGLGDVNLTDLLKSINPAEFVLNIVDCAAVYSNIWDGQGNLSLKFGSELNPLAEVAAWGQNNVSVGTILMGVGGTAYAAGATVAGTGVPALATFLGNVIITVATIFYMVGFTFGFIMPLYPFYRFFFGALKWVMSIFEMVVLAPLFALAHVNPYGEGLAGQQGKYGYSVAMQVLLRPILMIFGLIAGYLLFSATLHFLNDTFILTARGTGAYTSGNPVIARIVYTIIYCVMALILANQCFSLIGLFPQVAMSYLGMQAVKEERIGDTQLLTAAAAYVGKDMLGSKLPAMAKGPADQIRKLKDSEAAAGTSQKMQASLDSIDKKLEKL